jgi:hypothetical protein
MTLHPCASCRRHIDAGVASCPFCASPQPRHPMRSPLATVAKLSRAAVFAGAAACYTGPTTTTTTTTPPPNPTDTSEVTGSASFAKPPPPAPGRATLTGIFRIDGHPSPNTSVHLIGDSGVNATVQTDARGRYTFSDLEPGGYRLTVDVYSGRFGPPQEYLQVTADANVEHDFAVNSPPPDRGPCCKPYGAPPARRRVV